jgi:hypothetical protein
MKHRQRQVVAAASRGIFVEHTVEITAVRQTGEIIVECEMLYIFLGGLEIEVAGFGKVFGAL